MSIITIPLSFTGRALYQLKQSYITQILRWKCILHIRFITVVLVSDNTLTLTETYIYTQKNYKDLR